MKRRSGPSPQELADDLKAGHTILIHCGAGVGRTGTMGAAVLMALGFTAKAALTTVNAAGSEPETKAQRALLDSS